MRLQRFKLCLTHLNSTFVFISTAESALEREIFEMMLIQEKFKASLCTQLFSPLIT